MLVKEATDVIADLNTNNKGLRAFSGLQQGDFTQEKKNWDNCFLCWEMT